MLDVIQSLFIYIISGLTDILDFIFYPINTLISSLMPDLANFISNVSNVVDTVITYLYFPISFIPQNFIIMLVSIFSLEVIRRTILMGIKGVAKVFAVYQRIKLV